MDKYIISRIIDVTRSENHPLFDVAGLLVWWAASVEVIIFYSSHIPYGKPVLTLEIQM